MYFKRLEMHGFKSFADPVSIDFDEGITCIVGPNGSGKSNISDAIRWVLGEQSSKALRGGKMEEIIFSGTSGRKPRGMAEVELIIDNSAHILDIDYNEVSITRRLYRSGESEYLINGSPCRLRDIRELIMDTGIGVDGYSIIGQGKIADIVSTGPEKRREIFEEAAGVMMYKSKKSEAENRLEATSFNLERADDIIRELEGRLGGLRVESEKAERYLSASERYKFLETNIILKQIQDIDKNKSIYIKDKDDLGDKLRTLSKASDELTSDSRSTYKKREELEKSIGRIRDTILEKSEEISRITGQGRINRERLAGIDKEKSRISSDLTLIEERLKDEKEKAAELREEAQGFLQSKEKSEKELDGALKEYAGVSELMTDINDKTEEAKARVFELKSRINSDENDILNSERLSDSLLSRRDELLILRKNTEEAMDDLDRSLEEGRKLLKDREAKLQAMRIEEADIRKELLQSDEYIRSLDARENSLNIDAGKVTARMKTLVEMEANYEGYNYGVKALMREKLPGILGLTADLMEVPKGLEIAIETALGGAIQHIVCRSDEDAKRAIQFLKKTESGRLTFLPLESIRSSRKIDINRISGENGFLGLASDLVSFDPEYRDIYSYLLGTTVLVSDMDTAIRLSKKIRGAKLVTKDGEVVSSSGSITGGRYRNRTANLLGRKDEIRELEDRIKTLGLKLDDVKVKRNEGLNKRKDLEKKLAEKRESLRESELLLTSLESDIKIKEAKEDREREGLGRTLAELKTIEKSLEEGKGGRSDREKKIEDKKNEIFDLNIKIDEWQNLLDELRRDSEIKNEALVDARMRVKENEVKLRERDDLINHVGRAVSSYEEEIKNKKEQINSLEIERNSLMSRIPAQGEEDKKKEEKASLEKKLKALYDEKEALSKKQTDAEKALEKKTEEIKNLSEKKHSIELMLAKGESRLDSLKEKLWDAFEISYAEAKTFRSDDFVYSRALKESRELKQTLGEIGDVNVGAIEEYKKVSERYDFLTSQREDISKAKNELISIIQNMDKTIQKRFIDTFKEIEINFKSIFKELFEGGAAELRLYQEGDPLNSGVEIVAQPPGKKLQNINLLSGGEKTMTAIALMFAVLKVKPTPFCILDEVEAALDDSNIDKFGNYLRKFDSIQFAIITHQKRTMEHADVLYGVTMPEQGISEMLNLRLGDEFEL